MSLPFLFAVCKGLPEARSQKPEARSQKPEGLGVRSGLLGIGGS
ncbi:transcriptional repressor of the lac operon [Acetobacter orientalis]|uniref:Transcriptional repressor of the lac operon n=1 Tax=Acetobacter orientalis TaxID=146474 RepID=A0A2Z5ZEH7_9PROT|nr:transcriptional repressor of the lac operon [Acetobacter orientalis]